MNVWIVFRVTRDLAGEPRDYAVACYNTRGGALRRQTDEERKAREAGERCWIDGGTDWQSRYTVETFPVLRARRKARQ